MAKVAPIATGAVTGSADVGPAGAVAAKATGVSLRRDILAMEDAGARQTQIFTDLGVVTTQRSNAPTLTRSMLTRLAEPGPDVIVLELGDGLLGDYGVDAILEAADLRAGFSAVVLAANDPVGVWGGLRLLDEVESRGGWRPRLLRIEVEESHAKTAVCELRDE